jgi:hypothetical protein
MGRNADLTDLTIRVNEVIRIGKYEPGEAHKLQDIALLALVFMYTPTAMLVEVNRMLDADFPRWYE